MSQSTTVTSDEELVGPCAKCGQDHEVLSGPALFIGATDDHPTVFDDLCDECAIFIHNLIVQQSKHPERKPGHVYGCQCTRCLDGE